MLPCSTRLWRTIASTAGTGSEINAFGVISNLDINEKIGFGDPSLVPVLAIVDPELMKTVPAKYTAYQGFDALFHNTEVMISNGVNIMSETLALSANPCEMTDEDCAAIFAKSYR